jgi:tetratricopeptide (TPR) repeat protein
MLLIAGGMADREVALRYAEKTLHAYRRYGGVALAERAGRFVGRRVGFFLGLLGACARWAVSPRRRHSLSPVAALRELFKAVASTASSASTTWSVEQMEALADLVAPAVVSSRRVSYGTYLIARNFLEFRLGRYATLRRNAARVLSVLERDRRTPLSPIERVSAEGVARWSLAVTSAWRCDEHAAAELAQLETLDARVAALGSIQVRALHSRVRGEEEQAMAQERELELRIVQAGSGWAFRVALIYYSALIYGCCGDVVGLKRIIEELSRLSQDGFDMTMFLELARGDYHRERGELERSKEALERALELAPPAHVRDRAAVCAALAETELAGGEPDRALRHAEEAMALAEDEEVRIPAFVVRAARSLAFAHAMSGDEERAEALLARVASELSAVDCPAARGALAEAQARVAYARMRLKDLASYTEEAESYYRATANPALIARVGRMPDPLGKRRRASELPDPLIEGVTQTAVTTLGEVRSALSHSQGPVERSARVLDRLIRASSASAGYLYLWRHRGPERTAGLPEEEPPERLSELAESILRSGAGAPERGILPGGASWLVVPLAGAPPIGVVVLVEGGLPLEEPSEALVEELSRWLTQAGDIQAERLSSAPRLDTGTGPG